MKMNIISIDGADGLERLEKWSGPKWFNLFNFRIETIQFLMNKIHLIISFQAFFG